MDTALYWRRLRRGRIARISTFIIAAVKRDVFALQPRPGSRSAVVSMEYSSTLRLKAITESLTLLSIGVKVVPVMGM